MTDNITVAQRIDGHLNAHGEDAPKFAAALGVREITLKLLRAGTVKLPIAKVPAIATLMKADPYEMLRDVLQEYDPAFLDVLDTLWARPAATPNQRRLLGLYDRVAKGRDLYPVLVQGVALVVAKDSAQTDSEV